MAPETPLDGPPLGFTSGPEDLLIADDGKPIRIDKAYSWDAPLAAHGLMHMVIANAANQDPYPIDVLFLYMANMGWNSSMNVPRNTWASDFQRPRDWRIQDPTHHLLRCFLLRNGALRGPYSARYNLS